MTALWLFILDRADRNTLADFRGVIPLQLHHPLDLPAAKPIPATSSLDLRDFGVRSTKTVRIGQRATVKGRSPHGS